MMSKISKQWLAGLMIVATIGLAGCDDDKEITAIEPTAYATTSMLAPEKPVLYLYSETPVSVDVALDFAGEVTVTYPDVNEAAPSWTVKTRPDGRLEFDGRTVPYLFWEGQATNFYPQDEGFVVAGSDSIAFLEGKLAELGLNSVEAADFITYWAPRLAKNEYNLVTFATDDYAADATYEFSHNPDALIRVFMVFSATDQATQVPQQQLPAPAARQGFTVVEWGGQEQ